VTAIIFIFTVILIPVLVGEFVDWLPWVGTRLIRRAARRLPAEFRDRYEEEWQAEFNALPGGKLTKPAFGLRVYAGARSTGAALQAEIDKRAEIDNMELAARVLSLAQQTADQAIVLARREADETLGRARYEAERVLGMAYQQADQIILEARHLASAKGASGRAMHQPPAELRIAGHRTGNPPPPRPPVAVRDRRGPPGPRARPGRYIRAPAARSGVLLMGSRKLTPCVPLDG